MVLTLFNGDENTCGNVGFFVIGLLNKKVSQITSGGSESILMAMHACRNRALDIGIEHPEMFAC